MGGCTGSTEALLKNHTHPACAIATKDTLNDLSSVILCNLGDVRGERLSNLTCFLRENGARCCC